MTDSPADRPRGRVLVVDDEPELCRLAERVLGTEHEVVVTTSPDQALSWIRDGQRFDVILCDVMMPALTGVELRDAVLAIDRAQADRIVFVTASVLPFDVDARLDLVPNTVLRKPMRITALRELIRDRIERLTRPPST